MKARFATLCRFAAPLVLGGCALAMVGCDNTVGGESGEGGTGTGGGDTTNGVGGGEPVAPESIDALDLLLVIDGSGSMADKQGFLSASIRPFLDRIRSPRCVDGSYAPIANQPGLDEACPEGSVRQYTPDVTVHIGVISSSLGSGHSPVCDTADRSNNDDGGHLVWRSQPGTTDNDLPTHQDAGVFAWDPAGRLSPAGTSDFEAFSGAVEAAIEGVGELGCGFEMPLEAMYTFLNAPQPLLPDRETVDQVVLDQRAAFLRDDSVLQIILLSDENDVSFRDDVTGDFGMSIEGSQSMPRPRAECASSPNDACCATCIDPVPDGCSGDGGCAAPGDANEQANFYDFEDPQNGINIRAWDQKRRFGIDFLYPVERYVEGLQSATLSGGATPVPNPLYATNPDRKVLFTAVVGVPWQDVARVNGGGEPDPTLGFQSSEEMLQRGTWDVILGDPAANVPPSDPLMIESPDPRPGLSTSPGSNPINGNEWDTGYDDLQYACVFDLPTEMVRECDETGDSCSDCNDQFVDKPVCDPNDQMRQIRAKAYPGRRQLQVAKALGDQALVVPLCGLALAAGDDEPGPVGTFIMSIGLEQAAEQVATLMSGAE